MKAVTFILLLVLPNKEVATFLALGCSPKSIAALEHHVLGHIGDLCIENTTSYVGIINVLMVIASDAHELEEEGNLKRALGILFYVV